MQSISLVEALSEIPDPRSPHGVRHPLVSVLSLVVLGMLVGHCSLEAIVQFGREYGTSLAHALGFRRGKTPAKSTLSELLRKLDAQAMESALGRWIQSRIGAEQVVFSLDGKTLRGSRQGDIPGQHLVALYAPHARAVVAQLRVDAKTNEHKAALELLGMFPLKGKVVVGDAMFCQRDLCQAIVDQGGDYLLTVKDNQPGLQADIAAGFAFQEAAFSPSEDGDDILHLFAFGPV